MVLVVYGETIKGYRIYNSEKNSIITSRDDVLEDILKDNKVVSQIEQHNRQKNTSVREESETDYIPEGTVL